MRLLREKLYPYVFGIKAAWGYLHLEDVLPILFVYGNRAKMNGRPVFIEAMFPFHHLFSDGALI